MTFTIAQLLKGSLKYVNNGTKWPDDIRIVRVGLDNEML